MEEIVCEICVKDYNDDVIVPRVLICGHTICSQCITQIMQTSGYCPKCRKAVSRGSSDEYPINYSLLGMVDTLKNDANLQSFLQRRLKILKRKFVSLETKLTETKVSLENNLDIISTSLTSIQELIDDENIDLETCNQTILTLNQRLEDLRGVSCLNFVKLKSSTTLNCCDFQQPMEIIREIYKQVSKHEIFCAVTKVDNEVKFSRITVWGNKLILHALLLVPPLKTPK